MAITEAEIPVLRRQLALFKERGVMPGHAATASTMACHRKLWEALLRASSDCL